MIPRDILTRRSDAEKIRVALAYESPKTIIKYKCFNKDEADSIQDSLTDEERKRVIFTWLEFGKGV